MTECLNVSTDSLLITAVTATTMSAPPPMSVPETPAAAAPVQSPKNSWTSKLQAPDKEVTVRFTVDMPVGRAPQAVGAGGKDGTQESGYRADAVGGRVEGGERVGAMMLSFNLALSR